MTVDPCWGKAGACRAAVLADTHLRAAARGHGLSRPLPEPVCAHLARADVILHAGDLVDRAVLDRLGTFAPTYAVLGNNDGSLRGVVPEVRTLELAGVRIGMIHDSGSRHGRPARMRRRFPDCQVVVFGHSHAPYDEEGLDGQLLFNPGSSTQRRSQPHHTLGWLELAAGRVVRRRIVVVDQPAR